MESKFYVKLQQQLFVAVLITAFLFMGNSASVLAQTLVAHWEFTGASPNTDLEGNFSDIVLIGSGSSIASDGLTVTGTGGYAKATGYSGPMLQSKTLISWAKINDLSVRSGSILTIDRIGSDIFDGIVYAERQPNKWMNGSNVFSRTEDLIHADATQSTTGTLEMMAITYEYEGASDIRMKVYRNGVLIGNYVKSQRSSYTSGDSEALFGIRHTLGSSPQGNVKATIEEARIYDGALTQTQIEELYNSDSDCDNFTVYLKDSNGDPLPGGMLEFKDGGWQTASEIENGVFCVDTDNENINLRMTYAEAQQYETVPTNSDYTFQTVLTTFELRKRTGDLGYNFGQVFYVGFGSLLATTGDDGLGLAQRELLPREYTFRMKFRGGLGEITQDLSVNPVVTWQMARMLVQINKSDGTRGLNGADIKYKGSSLEHFGVTGTSENGRARKDLLPGFYKFTIKYLGGSMVVEDFEVVAGDNELIIDGVATTVELLDSDNGYAPLDGGKVKNIGITSNLMGYTGDSGNGIVTVDLLPLVYSFTMNYDGDSDTKDGIDVTSTPWVTFYTDDLKSAESNSRDDFQVVAYPNPFSGNTTIAISLEEADEVNISIFDINGKLVENVHNGVLSEGNHKISWDASAVNKGVYILRLSKGERVAHKNIVKM